MKTITLLSCFLFTTISINAQLAAGSWSLSGNSVSTNSFLGTTNNADLVFKRNNLHAGFIGENNVSLGVSSLSSITTGSENTSFGAYSLQNLTIGVENTSFGYASLGSVITGHRNVSVGFRALTTVTTGDNNIGIGFKSGSYTNGSNNIFIGGNDLINPPSIQTGNNNVIIGHQVHYEYSNLSDHIIIANGVGNIGLVVNDEGKVIIGYGSVTAPGNYKLYVEDGILTEKVKVALKNTSDWADHVFEEDYELMPLNEVEKFIKENKRLPGISSAETLVEEGIDLGAMQAILLEKIEELTLYLIQKDKEIEELRRQMNSLIEQE